MLTQVLLPLILAFMMFSMGLDLSIKDFFQVKKFPKAFILGLFLQFISLPVIAFALSFLFIEFGLAPEYAVGLIILAACPGGVTSNMITHLAKGDSALSISLTAVTSLASIVTLPFIVNLALTSFMNDSPEVSFPLSKVIIGIFSITTIPVTLGMAIKSKFPVKSARLENICRKIASVLFIFVVASAIIKDWSLLEHNFTNLAAPVVLLNVVVMLFAFISAKVLKLNMSQVTAITYECGLQNGTLAILVSITFLKNPMMMLPGGIYSIVMFFTAIAYYLIFRRRISVGNGGEHGI